MFSRSALLLDCMVSSLGDNVHQCVRNNKVPVCGTLLKYPVENDLFGLPTDVRAKTLVSFVEARIGAATNHRESQPRGVVRRLLRHRADRAVLPPVQREGVEDAARGALDVVGGADPAPAGERRGAQRGRRGDRGLPAPALLPLPAAGGYSALMDSWARGIDPRRCSSIDVVRIAPRRTVRVSTDDESRRPSPSCRPSRSHDGGITDGVPPEILHAADRLRTNATITADVRFPRRRPQPVDRRLHPRPTSFPIGSRIRRSSRPRARLPGRFSLQAEITLPHSPSRARDREEIARGPRRPTREGWSRRRRARLTFVERHDPAVRRVHDRIRAGLRDRHAWFRQQGIVLHGRFGPTTTSTSTAASSNRSPSALRWGTPAPTKTSVAFEELGVMPHGE